MPLPQLSGLPIKAADRPVVERIGDVADRVKAREEKDHRLSASSKEEGWLLQMVQHAKGEDRIELTRGVHRGAVEIESIGPGAH